MSLPDKEPQNYRRESVAGFQSADHRQNEKGSQKLRKGADENRTGSQIGRLWLEHQTGQEV